MEGVAFFFHARLKGSLPKREEGRGGREKEDLEVASPKKKEERRADVPPPPIYTSAILSPHPPQCNLHTKPVNVAERRRRIFLLLVKGIEKKVRVGAKKSGGNDMDRVESPPVSRGPLPSAASASAKRREKKKKAYFSPRKHASPPSRVSPEGPLLLQPHPKKGKKPLAPLLLPFFESGSINLSSFSLRFFP